jgi:hypothetical protein
MALESGLDDWWDADGTVFSRQNRAMSLFPGLKLSQADPSQDYAMVRPGSDQDLQITI